MKQHGPFIVVINCTLIVLLLFSSCSDQGYISPGVNDYSFKLSGGYVYYHAGNNEPNIVSQLSDAKGNIVVDGGVGKLAWDENIILIQRDDHQYYVIDVANDKIYGPSSKSKFDEKRTELGVSGKLTLKDVSTYRNLDQSISKGRK